MTAPRCEQGACRCGQHGVVISKIVPPAKPAERKPRK